MPDGTSLNRGGSKLKPLGLPARLRHCLLSNQTVTELKVLTTKSATNHGFDVTDFQMFTHLNPLSIQVNIRHKNSEKKVTLDDCSILSQYIDKAIQSSSILDQPFTLEISSEGVSDLLTEEKDYEIFKGFPIEVTYQDLKKIEQQINGLLLKRTDNDLQINQKGKTQRIPVEDVIQVRLTTPSG
ncbi:ribosome maturation factor RimP [Prochlorococcus marinus]|uniref:ribosome maturation factor RimP n=1 Tax=Prochlorococcus marinus TaxID=1219 RepID=UPI0022B34CE9|nr:ribosome maturation factor RimP [Prochlorococcus marinus]